MKEYTKWIWMDGNLNPINKQVCFRKKITIEDYNNAIIKISADSRYQLWINGYEIGSGPIRSTKDNWYYDVYDITHIIKEENTIAVKVWHYGHSNYQYIENAAGLIAQVEVTTSSDIIILGTDETWKTTVHEGYKSKTVKRNVNLGWMEYYDANKFADNWMDINYDDSKWDNADCIINDKAFWNNLKERKIAYLDEKSIYPVRVEQYNEIVPIKQVISLNLRNNFYTNCRNANAKLFSGYIATSMIVDEEITGTISFPHPRWNGVFGDVRIDKEWHRIDSDERIVEVTLTKGEHVLLIKCASLHDDLFCHIEFDFPYEIIFENPLRVRNQITENNSPFLAIGPFEKYECIADGIHEIYGGLEDEKFLDMDDANFNKVAQIASFDELNEMLECVNCIHIDDVYYNEHIYSLACKRRMVRTYPVIAKMENCIHNNQQYTEINPPKDGDDIELILDLGDIYAGNIEFNIECQESIMLDVYGFERMTNGIIEYTEGLNNSFRYITKIGRQSFKTTSRIGLRYIMLIFRKIKKPVKIYNVCMRAKSYPVSDIGRFSCSDPLLNAIWKMSRHTHNICMEDTFVDCPTYEQVFWIGDSQISELVNYYLFGSYELVKHCLELVPYSRSQSRLISALFPTDWQASIPMWTFNWIISIKQYVDYTNDTGIINKLYPEVKKTLDVYEEFINEKGLFDISSWNLLDWAPLDISNQGVVTAGHGLLAYCYGIAAYMAECMNINEDQIHFIKVQNELLETLNKDLWSERKQAFIDGISREEGESKTCSVHTHVLLYLYDCIDTDKKEIVEHKIEAIPENWIREGSPFMSFYLFEAWNKLGRIDLIVDYIKREWGKMLEYNSTTCWETFLGFYKTRLTRSYAHSWSTAPAYILGKYILGVKLEDKGFKKISIEIPKIDLDWAEGSIPTPMGRIDVRWSKKNQQYKISIPKGVEIINSDKIEWDYFQN